MKICPSCGNELSDNAVMCVKCGSKISGETLLGKSDFGSSFVKKLKIAIALIIVGEVFAFLCSVSFELFYPIYEASFSSVIDLYSDISNFDFDFNTFYIITRKIISIVCNACVFTGIILASIAVVKFENKLLKK